MSTSPLPENTDVLLLELSSFLRGQENAKNYYNTLGRDDKLVFSSTIKTLEKCGIIYLGELLFLTPFSEGAKGNKSYRTLRIANMHNAGQVIDTALQDFASKYGIIVGALRNTDLFKRYEESYFGAIAQLEPEGRRPEPLPPPSKQRIEEIKYHLDPENIGVAKELSTTESKGLTISFQLSAVQKGAVEDGVFTEDNIKDNVKRRINGFLVKKFKEASLSGLEEERIIETFFGNMDIGVEIKGTTISADMRIGPIFKVLAFSSEKIMDISSLEGHVEEGIKQSINAAIRRNIS